MNSRPTVIVHLERKRLLRYISSKCRVSLFSRKEKNILICSEIFNLLRDYTQGNRCVRTTGIESLIEIDSSYV